MTDMAYLEKKAAQFARIMNDDRFAKRNRNFKHDLCSHVHQAYHRLSVEEQNFAIRSYESVRYQESEATRRKMPEPQDSIVV